MIEVKNLVKRYGPKLAVDDVSFSVREGEIVGFLGPNGAGKTTTMNVLTGYISATQGAVSVGGYDVLDYPKEAKSKVGYLPERPPLYLDMTVRSYLGFIYDLKKCTLPKTQHISDICRKVIISDVSDRIIKHLSKGYQQRVGLAQALIGNPEILILDEPTVGLDPNQIIEIRRLIRSLSNHHTVILSSHILPEIQAVCDRVIIISDGKIVADGTTNDLSDSIAGKNRIIVQVEGPKDSVLSLLGAIPGVNKVYAGKQSDRITEFEIEVKPDTEIRRDLSKQLAAKGYPIFSLKTSELTLEDIFLRITAAPGESPVIKRKNTAKESKNQ